MCKLISKEPRLCVQSMFRHGQPPCHTFWDQTQCRQSLKSDLSKYHHKTRQIARLIRKVSLNFIPVIFSLRRKQTNRQKSQKIILKVGPVWFLNNIFQRYLNIILKMAWSDIWMRSSHCLSRWTLGTQARLRVICWTVMGKWEVHFFTIHYHYSYHQPHTPSENQDADAKNTRRSAWTAGKGKWSIRSDQVASNQDATLCTFTILQSSLQLRMVHIVVHSER